MITLLEGENGRNALMRGMEKLYKAVAVSMGPAGRNFYFEERDNTYLTKDGATIAKFIVGAGLLDKFERAGAALLRRASQKTEEEAGDATSASTIIAHSLALAGQKYIDEGANVIDVERGMRNAYTEVASYLDSVKKDAKDRKSWENVAYISARDKEVATMIGEAMEQVGPEGHIRIEAGDDWEEHDMKLEVKKGMTFPRGYTHDCEINDRKKLACILKNVPILVTNLSMFTERDATLLASITQGLYKEGHKQFVIIAQKFAGIVVDYIMQNNIPFAQTNGERGMRVLTIECPGYGSSFTDEFCDDIAVITGAKCIAQERGGSLDKVVLKDLGTCALIEATRKETNIVGKEGNEEAIAQRIAEIDARYENAKGELEQRRMKERKASLTTGMAVITVGGRNTENIGEKKARVEDAKLATKCAYDEGIVPGGGISYLGAIEELKKVKVETDDEEIGVHIVAEALSAPIMQIAKNCCLDPEDVRKTALGLAQGKALNMNRGKATEVDAFEDGVVDPVKSLKSALLNAIETALIFLTTDTVGVSIPEDKNGRPIFEVLTGDAAENVKKD